MLFFVVVFSLWETVENYLWCNTIGQTNTNTSGIPEAVYNVLYRSEAQRTQRNNG